MLADLTRPALCHQVTMGRDLCPALAGILCPPVSSSAHGPACRIRSAGLRRAHGTLNPFQGALRAVGNLGPCRS